MECMATKIQYTESIDNNLSWDERQKLLIWNDTNENSSEMLLDVNGEPEYTVVNGHVKKIPVLLSAKADYATYECGISDVLFKDTMMFEVSFLFCQSREMLNINCIYRNEHTLLRYLILVVLTWKLIGIFCWLIQYVPHRLP